MASRRGRRGADAGPKRRVSPKGERFDVVGRAPAIRMAAGPVTPAEAREELLVVKEGGLFLCARPDGDIHHARVTGEGLYAHDTRFLSELRLLLAGTAPVALSFDDEAAHLAVIDATNATLTGDDRMVVPQQNINVRRTLLIDERLYHLVSLRSYHPAPVATTVEVVAAADFADMFEVRGFPRRAARGHLLAPKRTSGGVVLAYVGEDELFRETLLGFDPEPDAVELGAGTVTARWRVNLAPGEERPLLVTAEPSVGGSRRRRRRVETAVRRLESARGEWQSACVQVESDNELFDKLIAASVRDLRALLTPVGGRQLPAAGIPGTSPRSGAIRRLPLNRACS